MNNNLNNFKNKDNLNLLWDVLLDELHINKSNVNLTNNIRTVFESNLIPFSNRTNMKSSLIELNKQFLSQVVLAVNKLFPNLKQDQNIKRINISNEEVTEPYKIEDIQATRVNEFEKELERKKIELEKYMVPIKPKELDFSDKQLDGSITALDSLVVEKITQRNLEIEHIQNLNYNSNDIKPELWLTPKETSIKNEKINFEQKPIIKTNVNNRLKYLSIDNNNNIILNISETENKSPNNEKKVSWKDEEKEYEEKPLEPVVNIFNKLKKQDNLKQDNIIQISNFESNEKQYVEQKSMELPEIKKEEIIKNQPVQTLSNNDPILPKTEIIKQLNELNNKINIIEEKLANNSIKDQLEELNNKISKIDENLNNNITPLDDNNEILINNNEEFLKINSKIDNLDKLLGKVVYFLENLYKISLHNNS